MAYTIDIDHLPDEMEQDATFGAQFSTTILPAANGIRTPQENWVQAQHHGSFDYGVMTAAELLVVKGFQLNRRGMARGFLFKDWTDYVMVRQLIGVGDGVNDTFLLIYTYSGTNPYVRIITRPVTSTLNVYVDNVLIAPINYVFTPTGGLVFVTPPANLKNVEASCEFDVPVSFSDDYLPLSIRYAGAIAVPTFGIVEIAEYAQIIG